jgi:uncharacterized repeat protein (TIGR03803 family)
MNAVRLALSFCAGVAILADCSGLQPPIAGTGARYAAAPLGIGNYKVLHSFRGGEDGMLPASEAAPLTLRNGLLYGTTEEGGGNTNCRDGDGCGAVFQVSPLGAESVLCGFRGKSNGIGPTGTLLFFRGKWYGMTGFGGTNDNGVVFSVDESGRERVVYRFKGGSDGSGPFGRVIQYQGLLYGTTVNGGKNRLGTVFTVTPSGSERVLYSFKFHGDGINPYAGLTLLDGTLYGTTIGGGSENAGAVFSITPAGEERVVYSFQYGNDGAGPQAGLIAVGGKLYGTTTSGGGQGFLGTVFSVTPSGTEQILHRFQQSFDDGAFPQSELLYRDGTLYGTTFEGGRKGEGIVFSLTIAGKEHVLHNFTGGPAGRYPTGGLTAINNTLYGTTTGGGKGPCYNGLGCGTIFALTL